MERKLIVACDFDGVITTDPAMNDHMELTLNCKEVIERLYNEGVTFILWTCRANEDLRKAVDFLEENEILEYFSQVNDNLPEIHEKYYPNVGRKIGFDIVIDDKSLFLYGKKINWLEIEVRVRRVLQDLQVQKV